MKTVASLPSRFGKKYVVNPKTGCWDWTASKNPGGYGHIAFNGVAATAHRISWKMHKAIPCEGFDVYHTCDNRGCVNPDHLFIGTEFDNMADMKQKGRSTFGEKSWSAKLTKEQVLKIYNDKRLGRLIAPEYGVCAGSIFSIRSGKTWSGVTGHNRKEG